MPLSVLISIFLFTMLSGCIPYVSKYTKIHGPEVTNSGFGCAADFIAPIYGKVYSDNVSYSVQIDPGYHYRSNLVVRADVDSGLFMPEPSIKIYGSNGKLISELFLEKPRYRTVNNKHKKIDGSKLSEYTFKFPQHPRFNRKGSIQLPDIELMGELREGITVNFKQAIKVGILPFNC